jgi:hypothetical protein
MRSSNFALTRQITLASSDRHRAHAQHRQVCIGVGDQLGATATQHLEAGQTRIVWRFVRVD